MSWRVSDHCLLFWLPIKGTHEIDHPPSTIRQAFFEITRHHENFRKFRNHRLHRDTRRLPFTFATQRQEPSTLSIMATIESTAPSKPADIKETTTGTTRWTGSKDIPTTRSISPTG